ncbi:PQQ-binding-like beta-propeller repeat protein [Streptomyces sp. NPDC085900]|uniref:protein kinase domain-containing protein n=1 Tax=Streptomyces sp. NPDC085900 TaxID=3365737 RepID=UPI0037D3196F
MALREGDPGALGEYRIVDRLGAGGMGVVYRARSRSGREVAVKVVHAQYAADPVFRARFRQEIAAVRKVSGAFTAPVVDADPEAELPWMATQYVPGRSLADHLRADGPMVGAQLRNLVLGLVEALRDIHRTGVVHRDLKPANVLMADDGPRVIDFGISRAAENQTLTETGHMMGTPPFMSPEQLSDARSVGPASDVFSLGSLVVFAATGRGPFDTDSPYLTAYRVMSDEPTLDAVPPPLREVVSRCLAKEPGVRPGLDELSHAFVTALPDVAPGEMPTVPHRRPDPQPTLQPAAASAQPVEAHPVEAHPVEEQAAPRPPSAGNRRLRVLVAVAGVLAVALTAYLLGPFKGGGGTVQEGASPSASATRWAAYPAGWRPWRTTVYAAADQGVKKSRAPEIRGFGSGPNPTCVPGGGSFYCAGQSALPIRVDAATGRTLWRAAARPGNTPLERYGAQVLGVRDGVLLVREVIGNAAGDDDTTTVSALAVDGGRRLWSRQVQNQYVETALVGGLVLTPDGAVVTARSPRDGAARWSMTLPSGYNCTFALDGDRAFADCADYHTPSGAQRLLFALDPADGGLRRLRSGPSVTATYAGMLDGRPVFVERRSADPNTEDNAFVRVTLIDPAGGRSRTVKLSQQQDGHVGLVHGVLCFVTSNGRLTAVSPLTGKPLWSTATTLEQPGPPIADGRRSLFVASASGRVAALDAHAGTLLWESYPRAGRVDSVGGSLADPVPHRGALLVPTPDGTLFTLDPAHPERKPVSG